MFRSILAILIVLTVASSAFGQAGRSVVPVHDDSIKGGLTYGSYPHREQYGSYSVQGDKKAVDWQLRKHRSKNRMLIW